MSNAILMSGGADDIDFMIHGLFSYQLFGHTVWITTSHVCILIVMLVILIFAVIANRRSNMRQKYRMAFRMSLNSLLKSWMV